MSPISTYVFPDKPLSLEMYPMPAVAGESLTLKCLVWGATKIQNTIFYKNNVKLTEGDKPTHEIPNVTTSVRGSYSCEAKFIYMDKSSGPPYQKTSDPQDVPVQGTHILQLSTHPAPSLFKSLSCPITAQPKAAFLSEDMSCSCQKCTGGMSYRFYKQHGKSWKFLPLNTKPSETGLYRCRLVSRNIRTQLSNTCFCECLWFTAVFQTLYNNKCC